jgi:hypothetical protein
VEAEAAATPGTSARRREAAPEGASNFKASDKEWHDLPATTKAKVNAGCAAEKAAKRAASVASSAKTPDKDKERCPRRVAPSSARALTPESTIGGPRQSNFLSRPSRQTPEGLILLQGHSQ